VYNKGQQVEHTAVVCINRVSPSMSQDSSILSLTIQQEANPGEEQTEASRVMGDRETRAPLSRLVWY